MLAIILNEQQNEQLITRLCRAYPNTDEIDMVLLSVSIYPFCAVVSDVVFSYFINKVVDYYDIFLNYANGEFWSEYTSLPERSIIYKGYLIQSVSGHNHQKKVEKQVRELVKYKEESENNAANI